MRFRLCQESDTHVRCVRARVVCPSRLYQEMLGVRVRVRVRVRGTHVWLYEGVCTRLPVVQGRECVSQVDGVAT